MAAAAVEVEEAVVVVEEEEQEELEQVELVLVLQGKLEEVEEEPWARPAWNPRGTVP